MSYQSEAELEKRLINDLIEYKKYTQVDCKDESSLEENFRIQFEQINQNNLNGAPQKLYVCYECDR